MVRLAAPSFRPHDMSAAFWVGLGSNASVPRTAALSCELGELAASWVFTSGEPIYQGHWMKETQTNMAYAGHGPWSW